MDEYGRPFLIIKEQDKKTRLTGLEAQKVPPPRAVKEDPRWVPLCQCC